MDGLEPYRGDSEHDGQGERAPFEPIGEMARWRTIVEMLSDAERGSTVTYQELADALDLDPVADRRAIQAAVRQAGPRLVTEHARAIVAVKDVGYRIVLPDEHVELAVRHQRKAARSTDVAKRAVDHVDLTGLNEGQRNVVRLAAQMLAHQQRQIRQLDLRQRDLDTALRSVQTRVERTEEETNRRFEEMQARIAELEKGRE